MTMDLVFVEFPEEVDAVLRTPSVGRLVALSPASRRRAMAGDAVFDSTLDYFGADAHERALARSREMVNYIRQQVEGLCDSSGISVVYRETVVWYTRWIIHYCLWATEIIDAAVRARRPATVSAAPSVWSGDGRYMDDGERPLSQLVERYANAHGLRFSTSPSGEAPVVPGRPRASLRALRAGAALLCGPLHRARLRALVHGGPVLFTTGSYRLDIVARQIREHGGRPTVVLRSRPNWRTLVGLPLPAADSFEAEAWIDAFEPRGRSQSKRSNGALDGLYVGLESNPDQFAAHGVRFGDLIVRKLRSGIVPFTLDLHRRVRALERLFATLKPSLVVSVGNRDDDAAIGEIARQRGTPAIIVPHGSYVAPRSDPEHSEWAEHGSRMIRLPYPYVALQSPLAAEYLERCPTTAVPLKTGPVVWCTVQRKSHTELPIEHRLKGRRLVLHAGTGKPAFSLRFFVYETLDEYVQGISDAAAAIRKVPEAVLVVKFRPSKHLALEDVKALVPESDQVIFSTDDPLPELLGRADLVVSFSSTVIEEALQSNVPVLLYGGGGRYRHIWDATQVQPDGQCPQVACYHVSAAANLGDTLARVLRAWPRGQERFELFDRYRIGLGGRQSIASLLNSSPVAVPRPAAHHAGGGTVRVR